MIARNNIPKICWSMKPPVTDELNSKVFLTTHTECFNKISPVCSIFSNSIFKKIKK